MTLTALVTGSSGFVGRHMRSALEGRGYHVTGLDLRDPHVHDCRDYFRRFDTRFDLVVHCAAVVGGRTMIDGEPLRLAAEDLSIDAELFRWALRTRPGRIVYFSSSAAYPVALQAAGRQWSLRERDASPTSIGGQPDQTYGWVKLTGERLAMEANREGIRTHVFRPFSGYGADQDLDYPFPAIVRRAVEYANGLRAGKALPPFEVWGHPGSARDWVHIDDVVGCVLAVLDADDLGPLNICTGRATTFSDLAHLALAAAGVPAGHRRVVGDSTKPAGVFWRVGDPALLHRLYRPTITVEEGVRRAVEAACATAATVR